MRYAIPFHTCFVQNSEKKGKIGRHCKTAPTKGLIFFNQSLTSQSNFKVSFEFCANEHGLNCRLNFWAEDSETLLHYKSRGLGPVSRNSRKVFGSEKPLVKLRPACLVKLVFSYVVEGTKINNCIVSCLETPSFWRYKENYATRNAPENFRDFRETGPWSLNGMTV